MGYIFSMLVLVVAFGVTSKADVDYNFEVTSVPNEITGTPSPVLTTSRFKKGSKSLKWQWTTGQSLTWDLSSKNVQVRGSAGIKIWIHSSKALDQKCLSLCARQNRNNVQTDSCFPMSLNFEGWRAAWVSYEEFLGCSMPSTTASARSTPNYSGTIDRFQIIAPSGVASPSVLHIDFLTFADKVSIATRDQIVPPLTYEQSSTTYCTNCGKIYSGVSEEDALRRHPRKSFWQQVYRWSLVSPHPAVASTVKSNKMTAINDITQRLMNWYANENTAFTTIPHTVPSSTDPFPKHRWNSLLSYFDNARTKYDSLKKSGSSSPNTGLFTRNDKSKARGGPEEFSYVYSKVLLPLTLEYHFKSRPIEVQNVACEIGKKYSCSSSNPPSDNDVAAITGSDDSLKNSFNTFYARPFTLTSQDMHSTCTNVKQDCFDHVKQALDDTNDIRKTKITGLFTYLKDQGLNKGSALGTSDHELLQMTGFLHSAFLMREHLPSDIIDTMKWYVDFGQVYQTAFDFKGSTADRIRSAMLYRLMTVLSMPQTNDDEKKKKIRDMDALKRWIENALSITEGLSGLIKPDYTCFHHKTFYASAYCPPALHTAALVSYLLEETAYELDSEIKQNIIRALKVLRIAAVYYSTPSQVGGRFPSYDKAALAEHVDAYAYMAMRSPKNDKNSANEPNLNKDLAEVRMFLRLYKPAPNTCAGVLNSQLCKGTPSRIYYLNTLGSLDILERVKSLAATNTDASKQWYYSEEESPRGHWSKQFAGLNVHRRDNWAVSVKGFDKYVWDFESGKDNIYGMYSSHGAMLIANSESALSSKNVDQGWDWRKIPGTTVINVGFTDMATYGVKSSRQYNPSPNAMAGGVFLQGSKSGEEERNGVFGMDFEQPPFQPPSDSSPLKNVNFKFKKSVFFYDDIIVSLGSNIQYSGSTYEVHTTLFQDLMPQTASSAPSGAAAHIFHCNNGPALTKTSWGSMVLAILVDVNGNRYYIPSPGTQFLVFHRNQRQNSYKRNEDPPEQTDGMYCTAWFNHGTNPSGARAKYDYAVQVAAETASPPKSLLDLADRYSVMKHATKVHSVEFKAHNGRGKVYGYVVFPTAGTSDVRVGSRGPIESVKHQSVIMAEEKTQPKRLYISVESPQLDFQEKAGSPTWCQGGTTTPARNGDVEETLLYCSESSAQSVHVNLRDYTGWSTLNSLHVGGKVKTSTASTYLNPAGAPTSNLLQFNNLRDGAETEVAYQ